MNEQQALRCRTATHPQNRNRPPTDGGAPPALNRNSGLPGARLRKRNGGRGPAWGTRSGHLRAAANSREAAAWGTTASAHAAPPPRSESATADPKDGARRPPGDTSAGTSAPPANSREAAAWGTTASAHATPPPRTAGVTADPEDGAHRPPGDRSVGTPALACAKDRRTRPARRTTAGSSAPPANNREAAAGGLGASARKLARCQSRGNCGGGGGGPNFGGQWGCGLGREALIMKIHTENGTHFFCNPRRIG